MRKAIQSALIILLLTSTALALPKKPGADEVLKEAKQKSVEQKKPIFLVFGASWCEACHQLDRFLAVPEIAAIFEKHFVLANLSVGEVAAGHPERDNPGADLVMMKYGGIGPGGDAGLPFIAVIDANFKLIASSIEPGKNKGASDGTGFPTSPGEIRWFLTMLRRADPAITDDESKALVKELQKEAAE